MLKETSDTTEPQSFNVPRIRSLREQQLMEIAASEKYEYWKLKVKAAHYETQYWKRMAEEKVYRRNYGNQRLSRNSA